MKSFVKIVSIITAIVMLITAFGACGSSSGEESDTLIPTEDGENIFIDATTDNSEGVLGVEESSSELVNQNDETESKDNITSDSIDEAKKTVNSQEAFDAFNKALSSQKLNCISVQQKIASGTIGLENTDEPTIDFSDPKYSSDTNEIKFKESFERRDKNGVSLSAVSVKDINKVIFNGNTLTLMLKDRTFTDNMSNNSNGYFNAADTARVKQLVKNVENGAGVSGVSIKKTTHNLSNGKIVAVFSDDFRELLSVKVSFTQSILVESTFAFAFKINADFKYDIVTEYSK